MNVLHLIDPASPGGGATTLRLLAETVRRLTSVRHDVVLIGSRWHEQLARRCGLEPRGRFSAPRSLPIAGRRTLARLIRQYEHAAAPYDLIHAWTARSAVLATLAAPHRRRLGTLTVGPVTGIDAHLTLILLQQHPMPLLAATNAVRREFASLGIDNQLFALHPPAVDPDGLDGEGRAALRRRWEQDDKTFIIGLLSEPISWPDARTAAVIISRLVLTGRDVKLLVHPATHRRVEGERWIRRLGRGDMFIVDDDLAEPWRVVQGIDAALLIGGELNSIDLSLAGSPFSAITGGGRRLRPMPGIIPLLWAMAARVPVIAEASDAVRNVIVDGQSGLLVRNHDVDDVCDRIMRLYDQPTTARRIGATAGEHVRTRFNISGYCVRLKEAYERLLAGRVVRFGDIEREPLVERYDLRSARWTSR